MIGSCESFSCIIRRALFTFAKDSSRSRRFFKINSRKYSLRELVFQIGRDSRIRPSSARSLLYTNPALKPGTPKDLPRLFRTRTFFQDFSCLKEPIIEG